MRGADGLLLLWLMHGAMIFCYLKRPAAVRSGGFRSLTTPGFTTVPFPVQEATVELVKAGDRAATN